MEEKNSDRRTARTRKAIIDAFIALLTEKELNKVTVQEIADRADINRATFYKHYLDVYDLYDKVEQEILVDWSMLILKLEELDTDEFFSQLVDHIYEKRDVFTMIFSFNTPIELRSKIFKSLEGLFKQMAAEKLDTDLKDDTLSFRTNYRSMGCISVMVKWVSEGYKQPKEFIVKLISELDANTEKLL